jgi:DNA gyrase subunit A
MGVVFARAGGDDRIIAIARNTERNLAETTETTTDPAAPDAAATASSSETPEESTDA